MATRFYLPSTGTTAITPAYDPYWTYTTSTYISRRPLLREKDGSALTGGDTAAGSGTPKGKRLQTQYIYQLPMATSFSGTATLAIAGFETNAADNAGAQCLLRVVDGAGATIGTLFAGDLSSTTDTAREFPVGAQSAALVKIMEMTLTPFEAPAGSYLVAEIGVLQAYVGSTGTRIGRVVLGAPNTTDHTGVQNEATPNNAPWLEFSETIPVPPPIEVTAELSGSGDFTAVGKEYVPPIVVNSWDYEGYGDFSATHDRVAWLRALPGNPPPTWTARRRWSSYGTEVDAGVRQSGGPGQGTPYRDALYAIYELPNTGTGGYNRMFRLIHQSPTPLSLAGTTQLHVHWFFSAGDGYEGNLQQRLILDGVSYSPIAGQPVLLTPENIHRTTYNINPTASVTTVALQWENLDDPIWQVHFDDIVRTPPAITAPQRTASWTGSGGYSAVSAGIVDNVVEVGALFTGTGEYTATAVTGGLELATGTLTGSGAYAATAHALTATVEGDVQTGIGNVLDGSVSVPTPSYLLIVDPELEETPSVLDVRVANVEPLAVVTFAIDGVVVGTETADVQGDILALSLDVTRDVVAGSHTLTATTAGTSAEAEFTVASAPVSLPPTQNPDLPPVLVDGSTGDNGVYRWVLQDLTPGGIGSWVMPINPSSMGNPHVRKTVAATSTTAVHGRPHVSEGATPVEWEFAGFAPDEAFQDKLLAYAGLRYRFYLIDHRNRAWIVSFASVDLVPRKRKHNDLGQPTDWLADYSVRAVLYSQTPQEVTP